MITLGILGSGKGGNFQAIHKAIEANEIDASISIVISDRADSGILVLAKKYGFKSVSIDFSQPGAQEKVALILQQEKVDWICLAGFMRIIKQPLLEAFPDRILNIHPSLLPSYPGLYAWKQAIDDNATASGCTVHSVDSGIDTGEILGQYSVEVLPQDTPDSLLDRIQRAEWILYPRVLKEIATRPST